MRKNVMNSGDKIRLEQMYKMYRKRMWYTAFKILNDGYEAEDAVHEAFIRIANSFKNMPHDVESLKTLSYLIKTVKNVSLNMLYDKNKRDQLVAIDELFGLHDDQELDRYIIQIEEHERLVAAIETLPEIYRYVLYFSLVNELPPKEIANLLGREPGTISVQLHRGKKQLLDILKREINDYDKIE